ncbi:MAG: hypothetical protein H8E73_04045 [Planctomycetes bacterium]|nr:hypothetical protein [Planctomycetota bacterium]MBL7185835.1 hypothetical protein [Phycisphaerae bacterium]
MNFRKYLKEYHALIHLIQTTLLLCALAYLFKVHPEETRDLFVFGIASVYMWFVIFYVTKPLYERGFVLDFFENRTEFFKDLIYKPQKPQNLDPDRSSKEWYRLQEWLGYQNRWDHRWYRFKKFIKPILVLGAFLSGWVISALLLIFGFQVPEDKATGLVFVIGICCLIGYGIGLRQGRRKS